MDIPLASKNPRVSRIYFPEEGGPTDAIMLVEGSDDFHLLFHFMEVHKLMGICTVFNGTGINDLLKELDVRIKLGDVKQIGIVVDADESAQSRWESIKDTLSKYDYDAVKTSPLDKNGTLIKKDRLPTIGIWIMPDNQNTGMVEDFVKTLIPPTDVLWPLAIQCVDDLPAGQRRFIPAHTLKAEIHTWLAWQEDPGRPMGQALSKKYLNAKAPAGMTFASWIRELFSPS